MPQKLGSLADGKKIEFVTFWGEPVVWRVIGRNLSGMPNDSVTTVADKVLACLPFDATEPTNSDSYRRSQGNNDWTVSNLRQWLNSDKGAGDWYSAQHPADQPPDKEHVESGYNAYDTLPGFLSYATENERGILLDTDRKIGGYPGNGTSCTDRVFLLTTNELGLDTIANNGTKIPYFADNASRQAYPTLACDLHSEYPNCPDGTGSTWYYYTATSDSSNSRQVYCINLDGTRGNTNGVYVGSIGVRPACNIKSDTLVSDTPNEQGNYTVIFNKPPTAPPTITVPERVVSERPFTVKWDAGTDPEGALTGYTLQRKTRSQDWTGAYTGSQRSYTDTLQRGSGTVQYRVRANDAIGLTSTWTQSPERRVSDNRAPVVALNEPIPKTVTDAPPKSQYTVTDADGGSDTVTAREYVDGSLTKTHQPELGQTYELEMDKSGWASVLNGTHTYRVEAEDAEGDADSKEVSWVKDVDGIAFRLSSPLQADDRPSVAVLTYAGSIPADAHLLVQVCNNGYDEEPTWVDATNAARSGAKVFLPNETKTADRWGFDVKVSVERLESTEPVYLTSINGNFA